MIVLGTSVLSELMRLEPVATVVDWVDRQPTDEVFLTAVTFAELLYGISRLPQGRHRATLAEQLEAMVSEDFDHRVVPFDETAATHFPDVVARRELAGLPISVADAQIAAICRSHDGLLATRNIEDFTGTGIRISNPWNTS